MAFIDGCTHCYGCAFSLKEKVVEDGVERPEQIGCLVGRLEQYEDNGAYIEEAYNEEENYYVIKNKLCSMYRTQNWVNAKSSKKDLSIRGLEKLAEEEIVGRLVDVVVLINGSDTNEEIDRLLTILDNQTFGGPSKVHLMLFDLGDCVPSNYIRLLSKYNFKWKFHHIIDTNMSFGDIVNRVGDKCTSCYYAVFQTDFPLRTDFTEKLFNRVYRKLKGFSLAESVDYQFSGIVMQAKAHKRVQGNGHEKSAAFKIKELAEEQKLPHMIINYEDLYAN